ncbi:ABC transporter substrate-binding protein [Methanospirillum lacunae]|nr:ABC transporter substrate-binding protein [Methanospirillum lacunae]
MSGKFQVTRSSWLLTLLVCLICSIGIVTADTGTAAGSTQTVTDMTGNSVQIPATIDRVADFWNAHNEVVLMLGAGDKLVATTSLVHGMPLFNKVYPRIGTLPAPFDSTTKEVTVEDVINAKPDVAIFSDGMNKSAEKLTEVGIPSLVFYFTTFDDLKKCFLLTGTILGDGAKEKAEKYNDYLDTKLAEIKGVTSKIPEDKKLSVLHLNSLKPLQADGNKTLIDTWINVAGGTNAAGKDLSGNMKSVTIEQIQSWNPDVIIMMGTTKDKETVMNDPQWKDLKAVKDGHVYLNPKGVFYWDRYGAEEALQIQWAAKTLYPDLFKDLDIKDVLKKFYTEFFDYNLTDDDINSIMNPTE